MTLGQVEGGTCLTEHFIWNSDNKNHMILDMTETIPDPVPWHTTARAPALNSITDHSATLSKEPLLEITSIQIQRAYYKLN